MFHYTEKLFHISVDNNTNDKKNRVDHAYRYKGVTFVSKFADLICVSKVLVC